MSLDLLQPSLRADPRSRAFAQLLDRLAAIPIDRALVYRIAEVVPEALPFLAEQFSIAGLEGWDWMQTEAEQRNLIKNAVPLHQRKGTLEGYEAILRLTKRGHLSTYIAPPDIPYPSRPLTEQEWADFLAQQPQIRIYRFDVFGAPQHHAYLRGLFLVEPEADPAHLAHPSKTDAVQRIQERPFQVEPDGTMTELRIWERDRVVEDKWASNIDAVIRPGSPVGVFLMDHGDWPQPEQARFVGLRNAAGNGFLVDHDPFSRLYRLDLTEPYQQTTDEFRKRLIAPSYEPLRVQYDPIFEQSTASGAYLGSLHLAPSTPPPAVPIGSLEEPEKIWRNRWNIGGSTMEV